LVVFVDMFVFTDRADPGWGQIAQTQRRARGRTATQGP